MSYRFDSAYIRLRENILHKISDTYIYKYIYIFICIHIHTSDSSNIITALDLQISELSDNNVVNLKVSFEVN